MYNIKGISLSLLTENGNPLTEYQHNGQTYVEGRKNSKYSIKVTNHTHHKVKAVISVDGLSVIDGKRASANSSGYILNPYGSQIINGWRISNSQIREFFFSSSKGSYNSKTGNDVNNLGVIGVMAFAEKQPMRMYNTYDNYYLSVPTGKYAPLVRGASTIGLACNMMQAQNSIGTGMGATQDSYVTKVDLELEATPFACNVLYYKTRKELEAMGIMVTKAAPSRQPSAFEGYCTQV